MLGSRHLHIFNGWLRYLMTKDDLGREDENLLKTYTEMGGPGA